MSMGLPGPWAEVGAVGEPRAHPGPVVVRGLAVEAVAAADDPGGDADGRGVGRDVVDDHGVGADAGPVADGDLPQDLGTGPEEDAVPQDRRPAPLGPDRHLVLDRDVRPAPDLAVDDDARG